MRDSADHTHDLDAMLATLRSLADDPDSVSIRAFADAVQGLRAELRLIEGEVNRLADSVERSLDDHAVVVGPYSASFPGDGQTAAAKP